MKRSRFDEEQIIRILKEQEAGLGTADLCRKHGISSATFYKWKGKYGGLEVSDARRLKALECVSCGSDDHSASFGHQPNVALSGRSSSAFILLAGGKARKAPPGSAQSGDVGSPELFHRNGHSTPSALCKAGRVLLRRHIQRADSAADLRPSV